MPKPALTETALLALWERAVLLSPAARERELARCLAPDDTPATLGAQRALLLQALALDLRQRGDRLELTSHCPRCEQKVEFSADPAAMAATQPAPGGEARLAGEGWSLRCRAPTPDDLVAVADQADAHACAALLLKRCVPEAQSGGAAVAPERLPAVALAALERHLQAVDPLACVGFELDCPACAMHWMAPFDVAQALWGRVQIAAEQLFAQVDLLARRYGWREADVLSMPPQRRRAYLQLAGA